MAGTRPVSRTRARGQAPFLHVLPGGVRVRSCQHARAVARALLWISAALIAWTQAGYALLLALLRAAPRAVRPAPAAASCRASR